MATLLGAVTTIAPSPARAAKTMTDGGEVRRLVTSGEIASQVSAGEFITARYDDYGWVSWQVAALKNDPPDVPLVVIVGGSAVRECVDEDEELATAIGERLDDDVRVVSLATMMQRLPSTLAILDNLPRGSGVVVIGVHHPTFVATPADAEAQLTGSPLLLSSPALRKATVDAFGGDPSVNILPGVEQHLDTYVYRRGVPPFTGRDQTYTRHRYDGRGSLPLSTKQSLATRFSQTNGAPGGPFETYFDFNVALLKRCVEVARDKGYQVVLMQDPIDSAAAGDAFASYEARYLPVVKQVAKAQDAHYTDLNQTAGLVSGDFFDLYHLLASGRAKWTAELSSAVGQILEAHPPAPARSVSAGPASHAAAAGLLAQASTGQSPAPKPTATRTAKPASKNAGDKAAKKAAKDAAAAANDAGGVPWWLIVVCVLLAAAAFLALLRRRAVVRRRRRARARARARRRRVTPASSGPDTGTPWWDEASLASHAPRAQRATEEAADLPPITRRPARPPARSAAVPPPDPDVTAGITAPLTVGVPAARSHTDDAERLLRRGETAGRPSADEAETGSWTVMEFDA